MLRELEPYVVSASDERGWPGTRLDEGTGRVHRYRLHPEVLDVVAAATEHLYGWRHPDLPQDIALVRGDGSPFLTTVTNEKWGSLALDEDERRTLDGELPELCLRDLWG